MSGDPSQLLNSCPACQNPVDVSACEPYARVTCPHCGSQIRVRRQFNQFLIDGQIGRGGLSRVFRATDQSLGRRVALKILQGKFLSDEDRVAQFEREARVMASVTHPNIVKLYSVGRDQGHFYIAMELVERGSFEQLLAKQGKLPESLVLQWGAQIARGLEAAWERGVIHRDIKPGNILLAEEQTAKIVDFGLALIYRRDSDQGGEVWATPHYMAPEKLNGQPEDFRGDIYSLGATLFHFLTGRPPFTAETNSMEELRKLKARPVSLRAVAPHASDAACAVIERMLSHDPEHRQASYPELVEDLELASGELRPNTPSIGRALTPSRVQPAPLKWAAASVLLACVAGAGFAWHQRARRPVAPVNHGALRQADDAGPNVSGPFLEARQRLLRGEYAAAREAMRAIHANDDAPQPTKSWAIFLDGLAGLFQGEESAARECFARLLEQRDFAEDAETWREFFHAAGRLLASPNPVPSEFVDGSKDDSARIVELLAYGLKNWRLGKFGSAGEFLKRFRELSFGNAAWVEPLQERAGEFVRELESLHALPDPEDLESSEAVGQALARCKDAKKKLKSGQPLLAEFEALASRLEERKASLAKSESKLREEEENKRREADFAALREAWTKALPLGQSLRFSEGLAELAKLNPAGEPGRQAVQDARWLWFLAKEMADEYLPNGRIPREAEAWIKAAFEAQAKTRDSAEYYRRQERLVALAYLAGKAERSEEWAAELSEENRAFRERWRRLQQALRLSPTSNHPS